MPSLHVTSSGQTKRGGEGGWGGEACVSACYGKKGVGGVTRGPAEHKQVFRMTPPPPPVSHPFAFTRKEGECLRARKGPVVVCGPSERKEKEFRVSTG
jgi:hypothetical protein